MLQNDEYLSDKSEALTFLLDKTAIPVYIFTGEFDWQYNTLGMDEVVDSLHWTGRAGMRAAKWNNWFSDGTLEGQYKHYKGLYYVHVLNAAHYVGMDLPAFTLDLMTRLMYGSRH